MTRKTLYRITFYNEDAIYELYARQYRESEMYGFIEVEDLVFGENTSIVVDPSEERLKVEFTGVNRTMIPTHSVIRIDEVDREGVSKAKALKEKSGNVSVFPGNKIIKPKPEE